MAKEDGLIIEAPRTGIAQSPHVGFGDVRNLDIVSNPGVAILNNILAKKSASTVDALVNWIVQDSVATGSFVALDANGSVYNSNDSGVTWAELSDRDGAGQGAVIWKDYLFIAEVTTIDVFGPLSGGAAGWTNNWQTITTDSLWHPMIVSKNDGNIYGGAGRYIFSIAENSGQTFAPGTAGTYTFTAQALDLPANYRVKCLAELGNNLMIGTWMGTNVYDIRLADIFPWDRSSASFGQPVEIAEHGVHAMLNDGNSLVVLAGIGGTIYRSDGVNAYVIGQIPNSVANILGGKYIEFYPGSLCKFKNRIFFGVSNGGSTAVGGMGVYSLLQTGRGNILNLEHTISTTSDGSSNPLKVSALIPTSRDELLAAWRDNATYGIDKTTNTSYTTSYGAYFETPLYRVGTNLNLATFTELEFQLSKDLAANEGIRVAYRENLTDSFTTIGTYDFSVLGAVISHNVVASIPATELLQLRVSLTGTTSTPQLRNIKLK